MNTLPASIFRAKRDFPQRPWRMALPLALACLLAACASEGRSPPRVELPEPGAQPRGAPAASAPVAASRGTSAGAATAYPATAPQALPIPGPGSIGGGFDAEHRPATSPNSAVNTLLAQADTARRGGDLDSAIAATERALRIAPADPAVYYELALLRLAHGEPAVAEQLARKGLSYQPDPELARRLQQLISRARQRATG